MAQHGWRGRSPARPPYGAISRRSHGAAAPRPASAGTVQTVTLRVLHRDIAAQDLVQWLNQAPRFGIWFADRSPFLTSQLTSQDTLDDAPRRTPCAVGSALPGRACSFTV